MSFFLFFYLFIFFFVSKQKEKANNQKTNKNTDDFLRIEFVDESLQKSVHKEQFAVGTWARERAFKVLKNGVALGGLNYDFLFFGKKQVRDAKTWMKADLIKGFDANKYIMNHFVFICFVLYLF